jgi:Fe2+ or Zn2+ uptake regulation protein
VARPSATAPGPADARATIPDLLAARGFRLTSPRLAILEVLAAARTPLSVAAIHTRVRDRRINLVSVYRTVHLLLELGLVRVADASRGTQRFELAEQFTGHHHHLVCRACGGIQELEGCILTADVLEALNRRVRRARNFRVTEHDVTLLGLCQACDGR